MLDLLLPLLLLAGVSTVFFRLDPFDAFTTGAERGLRTLWDMAARLVPLLCIIGIFRASGAVELVADLLHPVFSRLGLDPALLPLFLLRPISGSAALASAAGLIAQAGPDSETGLIAASVLASGETSLYVIGLYSGKQPLRHGCRLLFSTWAGTLSAIISVILTIRLFFSN